MHFKWDSICVNLPKVIKTGKHNVSVGLVNNQGVLSLNNFELEIVKQAEEVPA